MYMAKMSVGIQNLIVCWDQTCWHRCEVYTARVCFDSVVSLLGVSSFWQGVGLHTSLLSE